MSIPIKTQRFNKALKDLLNFYKEDAEAIYKVARRHGVTNTEIAQELQVTREAISRKFKHLNV